mgnify:FL=1
MVGRHLTRLSWSMSLNTQAQNTLYDTVLQLISRVDDIVHLSSGSRLEVIKHTDVITKS